MTLPALSYFHCSALTPFSLSIQGTLIESWADDSPRHHGLAAPSSGEEEEIQYASLSFHKVGPQDLLALLVLSLGLGWTVMEADVPFP